MLANDLRKRPLEIEGWEVQVTSCRIGTHYLAEVEAVSSGATISSAIDDACSIAEERAVQTAACRLSRMRPVDPNLTVGG